MRAVFKGYLFQNGIMTEGNLKENIIYTPLTICKRLFNNYRTVLQRLNTANERKLLFSNNIMIKLV